MRATTPLYYDCIMLSPDGQPMFHESPKRINWYVKKGLAKIVSTKPLTAQLIFEPRGREAITEFESSKRDSLCVVCGNTYGLSKHHIVPHCYRKHLREQNKCHKAHDVVALCDSCHEIYEREHAEKRKQELARHYGVPIVSDEIKIARRVMLRARALLQDPIPPDRRRQLIESIAGLLNCSVEEVNLRELSENKWVRKLKSHGEILMSKVDQHEFVVMWRQHFIETMKPKYMPKGWDINKKDNYHEPGR